VQTIRLQQTSAKPHPNVKRLRQPGERIYK
jgi:hypothetical protein